MASSTSSTLPPGLLSFLGRELKKALPNAGDGVVDRLLQQLDALAACEANPNSWANTAGRKAAAVLQKGWADDASLREAVNSQQVGLPELLRLADDHTAAATQMYAAINGHHQRLRRDMLAGSDWHDARDTDPEALRAYAAASKHIGGRGWVRQGIDWCVQAARGFFHEGGALRLARKEVSRQSWRRRGHGLSAEEDAALHSILVAAPAICRSTSEPLQVLDVGSNGAMFEGYEGIESSALDLCPQHGHPRVYQCDFLALRIADAASQPHVVPNDAFAAGASDASVASLYETNVRQSSVCTHEAPRSCFASLLIRCAFAAGSLLALPAASYDVLAFSLVLSYLPLPEQRGAMIAKVR